MLPEDHEKYQKKQRKQLYTVVLLQLKFLFYIQETQLAGKIKGWPTFKERKGFSEYRHLNISEMKARYESQ